MSVHFSAAGAAALLMAVVVALCAPGHTSAEGLDNALASTNMDFDYFLFVRQYPPTHCNTATCYHEALHHSKFTIHGLWPQYANGHWPQFCEHAPFDEGRVEDLMPEMREHWPSWFPENDGFWAHEWEKHGTCAASALGYTEHDYFQHALELHAKYNIDDALAAAGITPDPYKHYAVESVEHALMEAFGGYPLVHCNHSGVTEIWMCVTKDLEPFDCSGNSPSYCSNVLFPPPHDHVRVQSVAKDVSKQIIQDA